MNLNANLSFDVTSKFSFQENRLWQNTKINAFVRFPICNTKPTYNKTQYPELETYECVSIERYSYCT